MSLGFAVTPDPCGRERSFGDEGVRLTTPFYRSRPSLAFKLVRI